VTGSWAAEIVPGHMSCDPLRLNSTQPDQWESPMGQWQ
jgi:hypothetical protein